MSITFDHAGGDTFLEWVGGRVDRFAVNGVEAEPVWDGARIALPGRLLAAHNEIHLAYERSYDHTGEGFHQFIDPEDGGSTSTRSSSRTRPTACSPASTSPT